jgi:hypothetical protein
LSAVFCGIWVAKRLHFQKMTWLAWVLLTTGTGLNALMKPDSDAGVLYGLRVIAAVGGGFLFQLPIFAVQSTTINDDLGIATAGMPLAALFSRTNSIDMSTKESQMRQYRGNILLRAHKLLVLIK